jgi:hypothetical protein
VKGLHLGLPLLTNANLRLTTSISPSLSKLAIPLHLSGLLCQQTPNLPPPSHILTLLQFHHLCSHQCYHHPTFILSVFILHPQLMRRFLAGYLHCNCHSLVSLLQTLHLTHIIYCGPWNVSMF